MTHRGMHQFIPRHNDEIAIEIGDPLHVIRTGDDLWCEGKCSDLEMTHRGMHQFIPRHNDEIAIEIGDPLHVIRTGDDLWCEGGCSDLEDDS